MRNLFGVAPLAVGLSLTAAAAHAQTSADAGSTARASIGIRAVARTICKVEVERPLAPSESGVVDLGQMSELCNSVEGYRVVLTHAADLVNASAVLDGLTIPLSPTGRTVLIDSDTPAVRERAVQLDLGPTSGESMRLSLLAEPKGAVY